jgi:hypothetical protein
MHVPEPVVV